MLNINRKHIITYSCFILIMLCNVTFWMHSKQVRAMWANVPPVPTEQAAISMTLGDGQFFFRISSIMLQNLGDLGGMSTRMEFYDYPMLGDWFMLMDTLDSRSDFIPLLAAFYYGGAGEAEDLDPVIDYLAKAGMRPEGEKWRWLAQAVYLARYKQNDINKALGLAELLATHPNTVRPGWTYQMPAFVLTAKGEKEAAYSIMATLLRDEAENMHPVEVTFMIDYICNRLLDEKARKQDPLCVIPSGDKE